MDSFLFHSLIFSPIKSWLISMSLLGLHNDADLNLHEVKHSQKFILFVVSFQVVTPSRQSPSELSSILREIGTMNPFNSSLKVHFPFLY